MKQNLSSQSLKTTKELKSSKICFLDFDDFGEANNRLDWLWTLKKQFPSFKVNLFAIPTEVGSDFYKYLKTQKNWIKLCVHGYEHKNNEDISETWLERYKNLFSPIYRAPFWQLSDVMYERLKKLGYTIMIHPDDSREGIKYNWNIKDSPPSLDILYGHGHIQDVCENGLVESFENIMKLPINTEFKFL